MCILLYTFVWLNSRYFFFPFCIPTRNADWGAESLPKKGEKEDLMWQDNWDDEEVDDGFCKQLRAQLDRADAKK